MATQLPADEVLLEAAIAESIKQTIGRISQLSANNPMPVPAAFMPLVYTRERFPDSEREDLAVATIEDPVTKDLRRTNIIEIGMPIVNEYPYSGFDSSTVIMQYPIGYNLEVVDKWPDKSGLLRFKNSTELFKAVYMKARRQFKLNHDLGYANVSHTYLQQNSAVTEIADEKTGGQLHIADWSLTVQITGIII